MGKTTYQGEDRRRFKRIPFWYPLKYRLIGDEESGQQAHYEHGFSRNISQGGIKFRTDKPFEPSTLVEMKLYIPSAEKGTKSRYISMIGQVMRVEKTGDSQFDVAVNFGEISQEDLETIARFVELF